MFGSLMSTLSGAAASVTAYATKDVAEAAVAACLKIAYADGELEAAEKAKTSQIIEKHQLLAHFPRDVMIAKRTELLSQFEFDVIEGNEACDRELREAAKFSIEKRQAIGRIALMVAKSDGEIEPAEKVAIRQVYDLLGLDSAEAGV